MNRQARRKNKDTTKVATYNLTMDQIQEHIRQHTEGLREKIQHETVSAVTSVFLVCLHDEYGFGRVRMQRLLHRFENTFDCINTDEDVKLQDFYDTCLEEFGIDIRQDDVK